MIALLFGTPTVLLLLIFSLIFRIFRAIHDGLSERAKFFYSRPFAEHLYGEVAAWPWHIVNWIGRDLFIAMLYLYLLNQKCPWQTILIATILQYVLHDFFYWWSYTHRNLFNWGKGWLQFPSLFRDVFKKKVDL